MDFTKIIRKHLQELEPYSSARDEYSGKEGIFLDANENPISSVLNAPYNRYPDPHQTEIKEKLSKLKNVKPENIFLGNGSDEAIDLIIKAVCEPKEHNIVIMPPTYGMYKVCADIQQVRVQPAPLTDDFQIDMDNVFDSVNSSTKVIWICSPNNPSGNTLKSFDIIQIIKAFPEKIIVIDEAYIDFCDEPSFIEKLPEFENLMVIQTFSKAWGMAGLRLGVAYGHATIIKILDKIKYPYNLNLVSQQLLTEAIDKVEQKDTFVAEILFQRVYLESELAKIPMVSKIYPSDSNMILVKFENAKPVFQYLLKQKIILRDRSNVVLCDNCIRISVGTNSENETLIKILNNFEEA